LHSGKRYLKLLERITEAELLYHSCDILEFCTKLNITQFAILRMICIIK